MTRAEREAKAQELNQYKVYERYYKQKKKQGRETAKV